MLTRRIEHFEDVLSNPERERHSSVKSGIVVVKRTCEVNFASATSVGPRSERGLMRACDPEISVTFPGNTPPPDFDLSSRAQPLEVNFDESNPSRTFRRLRVVTRHWSVRHSQECAKGFPCQSVSKFRSAGKVSSKFRQEVINFPHPGIVCILPYPLSSGGRPGGGVSGRPHCEMRDPGWRHGAKSRAAPPAYDTRHTTV